MKSPSLKTILVCFGLFLFFAILRFPYGNFKGMIFEKIYNATKILIMADDIYPSFLGWPGIGIKNVEVTLPIGEDELTLSSKKLIFRVGLGRLFPPVPSVSLKIKNLKKGGDLYLKLAQGNLTDIHFESDGVELEQLKYTALNDPIMGVLNADGNFSIDGNDLSKSSGKSNFEFKKLKLPMVTVPMSPSYSFSIPSMKIGNIKSKLVIKNGVLSIQNFEIGEPTSDMQGALNGEIRLGKTWMASSLDVTLKFQLSPEYAKNPQATTLLSTLHGFQSEKSGRYGMRCNAKIEDIVNKFACAIPEKVEN